MPCSTTKVAKDPGCTTCSATSGRVGCSCSWAACGDYWQHSIGTGVVSAATIQAIAHSLDIPNLSEQAAKALAPDVEYKLRELIQDAQKFARHSSRTCLTTEDVNSALRMRNAEPLYGFGSSNPAKYVRVAGQPDLYCLHDPELPVEQLVDAPLPRAPVEVGVTPHWLFISGVQPATPENAPLSRPQSRRQRAGAGAPRQAAAAAQTPAAAAAGGSAGATQAAVAGSVPVEGASTGPVVVQPPVAHLVSRELQLYFERVVKVMTAATRAAAEAALAAGKSAGPGHSRGSAVKPGEDGGPAQAAGATSTDQGQSSQGAKAYHWGTLAPPAAAEADPQLKSEAQGSAAPGIEPQLRAVLASLATDPGLQPLTPYLIKYLADSVAGSLRSSASLSLLLRLASALLRNEHIGLEPYVHQLLPALLTCVVAKGIGTLEAAGPAALAASRGIDHWAVRYNAAQLVAQVCVRFGDPYYNVQPRISKTLLRALLDTSKPLATHYGAILGLSALGHASVRLLLLPQLAAYMSRLSPLLSEGGSYSGSQANGYPHANGAGVSDMETDSAAGEGAGNHRGKAGASLSQRQHDARRVHAALLDVIGAAMADLVATHLEQKVPDDIVAAARPELHVLPQLLGTSPAGKGKRTAAGGGQGPASKVKQEVTEGQQTTGVQPSAVGQQQPAANGAHHPAAPNLHQAGDMDVDGSMPADGVVADGGAAALGPRGRPAAVVLAEAWREDSDVGELLWAAGEVLGPEFAARMGPLAPQAPQLTL